MPERVSRKPIGLTIRQLRERKGWSLTTLAERAKISRSYLHQIEQGESVPTADKIQKLAEVFGVLPGELLGEQTEDIALPQSLREFAAEANLESAEIRMLTQIEYRGQKPSTLEEWRAIYSIIKGMLEK